MVKSSGCIGYASSIDKAVRADSAYRMRVKGCFVRSLIASNAKKVNLTLGLGKLGWLVQDTSCLPLAPPNGPTNIGRRRILGCSVVVSLYSLDTAGRQVIEEAKDVISDFNKTSLSWREEPNSEHKERP